MLFALLSEQPTRLVKQLVSLLNLTHVLPGPVIQSPVALLPSESKIYDYESALLRAKRH